MKRSTVILGMIKSEWNGSLYRVTLVLDFGTQVTRERKKGSDLLISDLSSPD